MKENNKKRYIMFYFNNKEYKVRTNLSLGVVICFQENRGKVADKDLIKMCILKGNANLVNIIDSLNKNQLLFILNGIVRNNGLKGTKIKTYSEFCNILDIYIQEISNNIKESFKKNKFNISINQVKKSFENQRKILVGVNSIIKHDIEPVIKQFRKNMMVFSDELRRISEQLNARILNVLKNINTEEISTSFQGFKLLLIELGYPCVDLSLSEMIFIYDNRNEENISNIIDKIILKNYTDDVVNEMVVKWNNNIYVKKRMEILNDAIYAYNLGKYTLSIPIFFSQLEGLVADYFEHKQSMNGGQYKRYIEKIVTMNNKADGYIDEITKAYFFNNVLKGFVHGNTIPKFSRHAIMHGGDLKYGTKINNLNMIITFDIILGYIEIINREVECENKGVIGMNSKFEDDCLGCREC